MPAAKWVLLIVGWTAVVIAVAAVSQTRLMATALDRAQQSAAMQARVLGEQINAELRLLRALPEILANEFSTRSYLLERARAGATSVPTRQDRTRSGAFLDARYTRVAEDINAVGIFATDASGRVVASSTVAGAYDVLGQSAATRSYFESAIRGERGQQFAMGKLSELPSVFFSAPVTVEDTILGTVIVKTSPERHRRQMAATGAVAVLLDDQSTVIASTMRGMDNRVVAIDPAVPNPQQLTLTSRRDRNGAPVYALQGTNALAGQYVLGSSALDLARWSIVILGDTRMIEQRTRERWIVFALAWLSGLMLILALRNNANRIRHLRELAEIDMLSGLGNRRHFEQTMTILLQAHDRDRIPGVSLAIFDIDRFKRINDDFGHAVGDQVIEAFATMLRQESRDMDQVFRLGGDEFALVLLETSPKHAFKAVQAIVERVRTSGQQGTASMPRFTCSGGMAAHAVGEPLDAFYRRTDAALYQAKENGRDQAWWVE